MQWPERECSEEEVSDLSFGLQRFHVHICERYMNLAQALTVLVWRPNRILKSFYDTHYGFLSLCMIQFELYVELPVPGNYSKILSSQPISTEKKFCVFKRSKVLCALAVVHYGIFSYTCDHTTLAAK